MKIDVKKLCVSSFKFEPIVSSVSQETYAHEMLTVLPGRCDAEQFFHGADSEKLFHFLIAQIDFIKQVKPLRGIFLNASCSILCDAEKVLEIVRVTPSGITFELNDPESLYSLSTNNLDSLLQNITTMKRYGLQVWIDDITLDLIDVSKQLSSVIYGVKIDKVAFWSSIKHGEGQFLLTTIKDVFGMVVVEGVENDEHFKIAKECNIPLCQGYKWSAIVNV